MDVDVVYFSVELYDSSTDLTPISVPFTILWDLLSDCTYQHKRPSHSPILSLPIPRRQAQCQVSGALSELSISASWALRIPTSVFQLYCGAVNKCPLPYS